MRRRGGYREEWRRWREISRTIRGLSVCGRVMLLAMKRD
jgi:hypothetical protein